MTTTKGNNTSVKADLAEIKITLEIMKKQIKQLEDNLGIIMPSRTTGYTDDDYREIINTRKRNNKS